MNVPAACVGCGTPAAEPAARFCHRCGEALPGPAPRWEGLQRWWRSLRLLLLHPGRLTVLWRDGVRRRHAPPLALFLGINVAFFVSQSVSGFVVVSIPLRAHLDGQVYSALARAVAEPRLVGSQEDVSHRTERFEAQQQTLAKASVLALVPPLALVFALLFLRRGTLAVHGVFATHFVALMMVFLTLLFPLLRLAWLGLSAAGSGLSIGVLAELATLAEVTVIALYVGLAARTVYRVPVWHAAAAAAVSVPAMWGAMLLHRLAVFLVTVRAL